MNTKQLRLLVPLCLALGCTNADDGDPLGDTGASTGPADSASDVEPQTTGAPAEETTDPAGTTSESAGDGSSGGMSGATETGIAPGCEPAATDDACGACIKDSCCAELSECLADGDCACMIECIEAGGDPFSGCPGECGVAGSNDAFDAMTMCQFQNCSCG